jgi:hypothetical protein
LALIAYTGSIEILQGVVGISPPGYSRVTGE